MTNYVLKGRLLCTNKVSGIDFGSFAVCDAGSPFLVYVNRYGSETRMTRNRKCLVLGFYSVMPLLSLEIVL